MSTHPAPIPTDLDDLRPRSFLNTSMHIESTVHVETSMLEGELYGPTMMVKLRDKSTELSVFFRDPDLLRLLAAKAALAAVELDERRAEIEHSKASA